MKSRRKTSTELIKLKLNHIDSIPRELLGKCFEYLPPSSIPGTMRVSKTWADEAKNGYTLAIVISKSLHASPHIFNEKAHHELTTPEWKDEYQKYRIYREEKEILEQKIARDRPYMDDLEERATRAVHFRTETTPCIWRRDTARVSLFTGSVTGGIGFLLGHFVEHNASYYLAPVLFVAGAAIGGLVKTLCLSVKYEQRRYRYQFLLQAQRPLLAQATEDEKSSNQPRPLP